MTLSNQKCQISPTLRKTEREWLDYQIDTKKRWASYSHFLQQCIHYFRYTEPKLKKRITQLEEQVRMCKDGMACKTNDCSSCSQTQTS